ncbi:type II secretion system protein, partial [Chloroflexota bacterium]
LIVVAILGVLAAVVIPNVGRFIGRGETEASATELSNIQAAVTAMMVDNGLATLPNPVSVATSNMSAFPDATSACETDKVNDPDGDAYVNASDKDGFILYQHDINAADGLVNLVNYVATETTKGTYTVNSQGTVNQSSTGY